jgi:hypothetical protein
MTIQFAVRRPRCLPALALGTFAVLACTLVLAACSSDFAPYSQLDRLRILAVQSDPATPMPGETAVLSALAFAPAGESPSYHWSWCPVTAQAGQNYACPLNQVAANQVFSTIVDPAGSGVVPSLDLGTTPTASLTNPFPLAALSTLCAVGLESQGFTLAPDCEGGYPILVTVDVSTASSSLRAGFVVRLPSESPPTINQNPHATGLSLAGIELDAQSATIVVSPSETVDLLAQIPADASELRAIPAAEGPPGQRLERLTASWFADRGRVDADRTVFIDGVSPLEQTSRNRWTAPDAQSWPADNRVQFMLVLRDDRGGVGWLVRQVLLERGP